MSKDEFLLYRMFLEGRQVKGGRVSLSDAEIAKCCRIRLEDVRDYIEQDIKAGMFVEKREDSAYYLTVLGLSILYRRKLRVFSDINPT